MFLFLLFFLFAYNNEDLRMFKYKANKNTKKERILKNENNQKKFFCKKGIIGKVLDRKTNQ